MPVKDAKDAMVSTDKGLTCLQSDQPSQLPVKSSAPWSVLIVILSLIVAGDILMEKKVTDLITMVLGLIWIVFVLMSMAISVEVLVLA